MLILKKVCPKNFRIVCAVNKLTKILISEYRKMLLKSKEGGGDKSLRWEEAEEASLYCKKKDISLKTRRSNSRRIIY
jgi:hypothetical protein